MSPLRVIKITIIAIVIIVLLILFVLPFLKEADTTYPKDYYKKGWTEVKVGMNKAQVSQLIGEPLYKFDTHWQYGEGGSLGISWLKDLIGSNLKRVYFDSDGTVSDKDPDFY